MDLSKFTLGIEEEYQIIDPETREVTSYIQEFLDQGREILARFLVVRSQEFGEKAVEYDAEADPAAAMMAMMVATVRNPQRTACRAVGVFFNHPQPSVIHRAVAKSTALPPWTARPKKRLRLCRNPGPVCPRGVSGAASACGSE